MKRPNFQRLHAELSEPEAYRKRAAMHNLSNFTVPRFPRTIVMVLGGFLSCTSLIARADTDLSQCPAQPAQVELVYLNLKTTTTVSLPAAAQPKPAPRTDYSVDGYAVSPKYSGHASWYGPGFHGRKTASGEIFNMNAMTAAHKTLPLGTILRVSRQGSGKSIIVRINDRGPYIAGRDIDLSRAAAEALGLLHSGTGAIQYERIGSPRGRIVKMPDAPRVTVSAPTFKTITKTESVAYARYLELGSFADLDGALALYAQLRTQCLSLGINRADDQYRLMAGPFANADVREQTAEQLKAQGFTVSPTLEPISSDVVPEAIPQQTTKLPAPKLAVLLSAQAE